MRSTVAATLALGLLAAGASAQEPRPPRIAIIDMARVSADSSLGKIYAAKLDGLKKEIEAAQAKKRGEAEKMQAALTALQEELTKQQGVMSADAADRKQQDIVKKRRELQNFVEDGQAELQRMQERARGQAEGVNKEFQEKVKPLVEQVAKEKGIDILLDSQVAFTVSEEYDISAAVIQKLDAMPAASK